MQVDQQLIKQCYEDKEVTINDRTYKMLTVPYKRALQVVGYGQKIEKNLLFVGDPGWLEMEELLKKYFTYDGDILAKSRVHFEDYPEDYMTFVAYAVGMIVYPFMRGTATG